MEDLKEEISFICHEANRVINLLQCLDNRISIEFIDYIVGEIAGNGYCDDEYAYNFIGGDTEWLRDS